MSKRTRRTRAFVAILIAAVALVGTAVAQKAVPKAQDKLAIGESEVRQLLLLMDTDKHGKVSRQDYMKFMEAEFERLDKAKTGVLDAKELTKSNSYTSALVGK